MQAFELLIELEALRDAMAQQYVIPDDLKAALSDSRINDESGFVVLSLQAFYAYIFTATTQACFPNKW